MRVDAKKEPQATRMTSSDRQVEDLHSELLSVKSSERKAALKKLLSWLDVGTFLVKLDENTHKLATEKSTPLSPLPSVLASSVPLATQVYPTRVQFSR